MVNRDGASPARCDLGYGPLAERHFSITRTARKGTSIVQLLGHCDQFDFESLVIFQKGRVLLATRHDLVPKGAHDSENVEGQPKSSPPQLRTPS